MSYNLDPVTREETLMAEAAGREVADLTPVTRKEMFLKDIAEAGGGGGGGGFTPTQNQLDAMNSGITAARVGELEGIDDTGDNYIEVNGVKLYFGATEPSNPSDGDWWLD